LHKFSSAHDSNYLCQVVVVRYFCHRFSGNRAASSKHSYLSWRFKETSM